MSRLERDMTFRVAIQCILFVLAIFLWSAAFGVELPDEMDAGDKAAYLKLLENYRDDIKFGRSLEVHHIYENAPPVEGSPAVYVYNWKEAAPLYAVNTIDKNGRIVSLNLHGKILKDLSLLKSFVKLKYLSLDYNVLKSVKSLPFLPELEELHLNNNLLAEIPKLNLPKLRYLDVSYNPVENILGLMYLKDLEIFKAELMPKDGKIHGIEGLLELTNLKELNLDGHPIESIKGVGNFKKLQNLNLHHSKINSVFEVSKLTGLVDLELGSTNIESLDGLNNLTKLARLNISGTKIENLNGIEELVNLKTLFLFNTKVSSLSQVKSFQKLERLGVGHTRVTDFYPLLGLKKLQAFTPPNASINGGEYPDTPALSMEQRHVMEKIIKRGEENYQIAQQEKYRAERKAEVKANKAILRVRKKMRAYKAARLAKE